MNIKGEIKLDVWNRESNNCDREIVPLLPFIPKRNPFQIILCKERNRK
jgi:hypothetical protein